MMNKPRRKHIDEVLESISVLKDEIESIFDEEEEYRDNIPENLWGSARYDIADAACDTLQMALDDLDSVMDNLEEAKG